MCKGDFAVETLSFLEVSSPDFRVGLALRTEPGHKHRSTLFTEHGVTSPSFELAVGVPAGTLLRRS